MEKLVESVKKLEEDNDTKKNNENQAEVKKIENKMKEKEVEKVAKISDEKENKIENIPSTPHNVKINENEKQTNYCINNNNLEGSYSLH